MRPMKFRSPYPAGNNIPVAGLRYAAHSKISIEDDKNLNKELAKIVIKPEASWLSHLKNKVSRLVQPLQSKSSETL